jgi:transglutaminase-like putative cysteine protease
VSAGAQVAVLPAGSRHRTEPVRAPTAKARERPWLRLATFGALCAYGAIRWSTLLVPAPTGRLIGLVALAIVVAGLGPFVARQSTAAAVLGGILAVLAMFAFAGVPLSWIRHVRITVTANAIGDGLSALPGLTVPYGGINEWARMVNLLGAGILLLDAAMLLAFATTSLSDLRRAAVALPLVALAIVPETLLHPQLPYLQGAVLFGLIAAFMWGERIRDRHWGAAAGLAALAAAAAVAVAPAFYERQPWVNYEALASALAPGHVEHFNWSQTYGPLIWPHAGREVLEVKAKRADYWKAENLDLFDGVAWSDAVIGASSPVPSPDAKSIAEWTQPIQVTIGAMQISNVIAAGDAQVPSHLPGQLFAGSSPGTWTTTNLAPGDSYEVTTYSPRPTATQLEHDTRNYPSLALAPYLAVGLPGVSVASVGQLPPQQVSFFPFGTGSGVANSQTTVDPAVALRHSPYEPAYELARRLARESATPYACVKRVMRYLSPADGFRYDLNPPVSPYPLETFLFDSKLGYCQQFAGAMSLLLRMGGVPARVSVGFTPGSYDGATHSYIVTDQDAHAWVEVWFPRYGWVRFDPTPAATAGQSARAISPLGPTGLDGRTGNSTVNKKGLDAVSIDAGGSQQGGGGGAALVIAAGLLALLVIAFVAAKLWPRREPSLDELMRELERALRRSGRPLQDGVTLAGLEERFRGSPLAASYIRTLRLARFAGRTDLPDSEQRRALRSQLGAGLGFGGMLRALWALPPRLGRVWTRSRQSPVLNSH